MYVLKENDVKYSNSKRIVDEMISYAPEKFDKSAKKYNPRKSSAFAKDIFEENFYPGGLSIWFVVYSDVYKIKQDKNKCWKNTLSNRDEIIEEYLVNNGDYIEDLESSPKRLIFAHIGNSRNYIFLGIYERQKPTEINGHNANIYKRIDREFVLK